MTHIILFGVASIALVFGLALVNAQFPDVKIFTVVGMFNSVILLIAVPAYYALKEKPYTRWGLWTTIVLGVVLVFLATYGPVEKIPLNVQIVLPFFAALLATLIGKVISKVTR